MRELVDKFSSLGLVSCYSRLTHPVRVVDDDRVCCNQIEPQSPSSGAQQEHMAIRVLTKSEHLVVQKYRLANIIILSSRQGLRKIHTYSIDTVLSVCYSSNIVTPDLSLSLGEGHGPIQSAVPDSPQVQVVLKDIQHHCELREHQCLHERKRQRGLKLILLISL